MNRSTAFSNRVLLYTRSENASMLDEQLKRLADFAQRRGLQVVDAINEQVGQGVSDVTIQRLIKRKWYQNDFDLILMTDCTRLARNSITITYLVDRLRFARIGCRFCDAN